MANGIVALAGAWPALALFVSGCASAPPPGAHLTDHGTVAIVTTKANGEPRTRTIWIVALDGQPFIRTGNTRWFRDLEQRPEATVRGGDLEYSVRARVLDDAALEERVHRAFREKYGFSDRMAGWVTFGERHVLRLDLLPTQ